MASSQKKVFSVPLLDEATLEGGSDKEQISTGSIFKAHRRDVQLNIQNQSPLKQTPSVSSSVPIASARQHAVSGQGDLKPTTSAPSVLQPVGAATQSNATRTARVTFGHSQNSSEMPVNIHKCATQGDAVGTSTSSVIASSVPNSKTIQSGAGATQAAKSAGSSSSLIVSPRQRGNPILKSVRNVPWEFGDIVPDYQLGKTSCALFLSLRYHNLNPNYIHGRLKNLGHSFELRVLLAQVDIKDPHHALKELAQICLLSDTTLILALSAEEAGRYLETFKAYENKPPDLIMEKTESNFLSQFTDCITSTKKVNKTDAMTLLATFGSFADIAKQSEENLSLCPGFGPNKAKRLYDVMNEPFLKSKKKTKVTKTGSDSEAQASTSGSKVT